jgi:hypothetical protein
MTKWIALLLLKLAGHLTGKDYVGLERSKIAMPDEVLAITDAAMELCANAERSRLSGGWKRAVVMTRLRKMGVADRDASLAIELAVRSMEVK